MCVCDIVEECQKIKGICISKEGFNYYRDINKSSYGPILLENSIQFEMKYKISHNFLEKKVLPDATKQNPHWKVLQINKPEICFTINTQ